MHSSSAFLLVGIVGLVSGQATSSCAAANIVSACSSGIAPRITGCTGGDYNCLCSAYTDMKTCYNNCPNDSNGYGVSQQVVAYCNAAAQVASMSSMYSAQSTFTITTTTYSTSTASMMMVSAGNSTMTSVTSSAIMSDTSMASSAVIVPSSSTTSSVKTSGSVVTATGAAPMMTPAAALAVLIGAAALL